MTPRLKLTLRHSIQALVAGGLLLTGAASVQAQEQEAESRMALEEVIVTARKIAESLQETPVAITAWKTFPR